MALFTIRQLFQKAPFLSLSEAEFLNIIGTKVLGVFLLAIHAVTATNGFYPPPPALEQKWFETGF
jgi:hypothetical protein